MPTSYFPSLAALGRNPAIAETLKGLSLPGLVLVSGTTGSGRSTTLAAMGAEMLARGYKVCSVRTRYDDETPGIPEVVCPDFGRSTVRAVLGAHQPDVVIIDRLTTPDAYGFAVDLAAKDALVIAGVLAVDAADAVNRVMDNYPGLGGRAAVSAVMVMSVHQTLVRAERSEYSDEHWNAVGKAECLISMANPFRPPFTYWENRKVETDIRVYAATL